MHGALRTNLLSNKSDSGEFVILVLFSARETVQKQKKKRGGEGWPRLVLRGVWWAQGDGRRKISLGDHALTYKKETKT